MITNQKSRRKDSFLLKLINENKNLINEFSSSSDSDSPKESKQSRKSHTNISKSSSFNEDYENLAFNKIESNEINPILGNAYHFSKQHDKYQKLTSQTENKRILILYTGGTFGMEKSEEGLKPKANFLLSYMFNHSNFCDKEYTIKYSNPEKEFDLNRDFLISPETLIGKRIFYKIYEFDNIIDSSNMNMEYWQKIGRSINKFYYQYDSFVILHGTDTMNYTASILSFMLENLNKLVILTGSQIPLIEMRNDAQKNLLDALTISGTYNIPEVCLLFDSKLFRGNRTIKNDNINLDAFESPNLQPLVKIGINVKINWDIIRPKSIERFNYFENLNNDICIIKFFPIIQDETFESFFQPPIQAVIIETYGRGNLPSNRPFILQVLKNATDNGIIIINVSQCRKGLVGESSDSGNLLESIGVINAWDMTVECALAKLSYLLGKNYDNEKIKVLFQQDLRGELTMRQQELFSLYSNAYINSVLKMLGLEKSNEENFSLAQSLIPTIIKDSVENNDLTVLKNMKNEISNFCFHHYTKKGPLHISCKAGYFEVTQFLISCKMNVNDLDYIYYTPLDYACEYKHREVALLIKQNGGILNTNKNNFVLFNNLAFKGDLDTIKILFECGADLLTGDYDGRNIAHIASSENKVEIIEYLLFEAKLDIMKYDRWKTTPYSDANEEIRELIKKKYKIEVINERKSTIYSISNQSKRNRNIKEKNIKLGLKRKRQDKSSN